MNCYYDTVIFGILNDFIKCRIQMARSISLKKTRLVDLPTLILFYYCIVIHHEHCYSPY